MAAPTSQPASVGNGRKSVFYMAPRVMLLYFMDFLQVGRAEIDRSRKWNTPGEEGSVSVVQWVVKQELLM